MSEMGIHTSLYLRENRLWWDFDVNKMVTMTCVGEGLLKNYQWEKIIILIAARVQTALYLTRFSTGVSQETRGNSRCYWREWNGRSKTRWQWIGKYNKLNMDGKKLEIRISEKKKNVPELCLLLRSTQWWQPLKTRFRASLGKNRNQKASETETDK